MEELLFTNDCEINTNCNINFDVYKCSEHNWNFCVFSDITTSSDYELKDKIYNLIFEWMLNHENFCKINGKDFKWHFYYIEDEPVDIVKEKYYINIADLMKSYPISFIEKAERTLINISKLYPIYGEIIMFSNFYDSYRAMMLDELEISFIYNGIADALVDLDYLKSPKENQYMITAQGWQHIEELEKEQNTYKQGFIAMGFGSETKSIRKIFKNAINDSGYSVSIIDEKEHNNQIVPEIFYEIEKSKFMVVDVTYPNYGAYYEAGYGQALGKEVIVCCKKDVFEDKDKRPHFDIAQKSTIVWENEDDLYRRLKRRIAATVK